MFSHDKTGFKQLLLDFPTQLDMAEDILDKANVKIDASKINNILYLGMGGSAIAGDLLKDILIDEIKVPISVVRGYKAPHFCNKNTLVIVSSYSGNTEETFSAASEAKGSGAQFLAISSGGKIGELAKENSWNMVTLPGGFPPRQSLGITFFALYKQLGNLGILENYVTDFSKLKSFVQDEITKHDYQKHGAHILAQELAKTIHNRIPVIYSTAPFLKSVSTRWQNQLQENSKNLAFKNVIPEMNHNEIVGWEMDTPLKESLVAIFLENENVNPRIKQRIELSKKIIKKSGSDVVDIYASGSCALERVLSLIILGDWVSYYLAKFNKVDPIEIKNIDYLKTELAKTN